MGSIILLGNVFIWLVTLLYFYKKKNRWDAGNLLLLTFLVYSICSLVLVANAAGGEAYENADITFFPLLFLYVCIIISILPVLLFNQNKIKNIQKDGLLVIDIISCIFIGCALIKIPLDLMHIKEGILLILMDSSGGSEVYQDTLAASRDNLGDGNISSLPSIIINAITEIIIIILYYNFSLNRRKKISIFLLIILCILPFSYLANSQRGPAIAIISTLFISYFILNKFYSERLKRVVRKLSLIVGILIVLVISAITISRFGQRDGGAIGSVFAYGGQQNINFDLYAFDNNGLRYGDRVVPLFKSMLGFKDVPSNFWERRSKYPYLKINDEVFIGYVGDFVLDFGPIVSLLIFILLSSINLKITKLHCQKLYFYQLLVLQLLVVLAVQGGLKLYPFADKASLKIIAFFIVFVLVLVENTLRKYKIL